MAYTDRRTSDYGTSLSGSGSIGRIGGPDHHDPLSIHQALQNAVDDQEQNQVCDETATTFMTDLPLLKSELFIFLPPISRWSIEDVTLHLKGKQQRVAIDEIITLDHKCFEPEVTIRISRMFLFWGCTRGVSCFFFRVTWKAFGGSQANIFENRMNETFITIAWSESSYYSINDGNNLKRS